MLFRGSFGLWEVLRQGLSNSGADHVQVAVHINLTRHRLHSSQLVQELLCSACVQKRVLVVSQLSPEGNIMSSFALDADLQGNSSVVVLCKGKVDVGFYPSFRGSVQPRLGDKHIVDSMCISTCRCP